MTDASPRVMRCLARTDRAINAPFAPPASISFRTLPNTLSKISGTVKKPWGSEYRISTSTRSGDRARSNVQPFAKG